MVKIKENMFMHLLSYPQTKCTNEGFIFTDLSSVETFWETATKGVYAIIFMEQMTQNHL